MRDRGEAFERERVAHQHALFGRAADRDQDCRRRGEAERARAGHREHGDRRQERRGGIAACGEVRDESAGGDEQHGRNEHRRDTIGEALRRGVRGLCVGDELGDARERRVVAGALAGDVERAVQVHRAGKNARARRLLDGDRLAGQHRLVDAAGAFADDAIDRQPLAGPHAHELAGAHPRDRNVPFGAAFDQVRDFRTQAEQPAERVLRASLRPILEVAAEQREGDDDRGRLEKALMTARDEREDAEAKRRERAKRDQRLHVRGRSAGASRRDAQDARPRAEDDRRRERGFDPTAAGERRQHHRDRDQRQREHPRDHQPARTRHHGGCWRFRGRLDVHTGGVPGAGDRLLHRLGRAIEFDARGLRREVHGNRPHPGHAADRALDAPHARRAGHPLDLERHAPCRRLPARTRPYGRSLCHGREVVQPTTRDKRGHAPEVDPLQTHG